MDNGESYSIDIEWDEIIKILNEPSSTGRSKKRPREEVINELTRISAKRFRAEQPESSADSVTSDETHIIFFEPFLNYPIKVQDDLWMEPTYWALAFLQTDIQSVAEVLCKALFTSEELQKRNPSDPVDTLPNVKTLVILRLAKWMMNKEQDPWAYNPHENNCPYPSVEEEDLINEVFQRFSTVYPKGDLCTCKNGPASPLGFLLKASNSSRRESQDITSTTTEFEDQNDPHVFNRDHLFKAFMYLSDPDFPLYSAHVAKSYTKSSIQQNTDIFVDAVQFSRGRWAKAFKKRNVAQMADVLFRKYLKVDYNEFNQKEFETFDQFCPVKRLAIIRAVAWMKEKNKIDPFGFDSTNPTHNLFLSPDEIRDIETFINQEYGPKGPSTDAQVDIQQKFPDSLNMNMDTLEGCDTGPANTSNMNALSPSHGQVYLENELAVASKVASSQHQNLTSDSTRIVGRVLPQQSNPQLNMYGHYPITQNEHSLLSDQGISSLSFQHFEQNPNLDISTTTIGATNIASKVESTSPEDKLYPIFDEAKQVIFPGCTIKYSVWEKAYEKIEPEKGINSVIQAGKYLLEEVFTNDEILNCTVSGRKGKNELEGVKRKFDSQRIAAILNAVNLLKSLKTDRKGPAASEQVKLVPMEVSERKHLITKIFVEHRNYLAKRK